MLTKLESAHFRLTLDPARGCWGLTPSGSYPALENLRLRLLYRSSAQRFTALETWPAADLAISEATSPYGDSRQLTLIFTEHALRFTLTFALPRDHPLCLWRLSIENTGRAPVYLDRIEMLDLAGIPLANPAFLANGWQSWSYTGVYGAEDRFRRTRLGPLVTPLRVNAGTPQPRQCGHFASDMFGVLGDRLSRQALLAGFLSQQQHFGSLQAFLHRLPATSSLKLWANGDGARLDPGLVVTTDWACLHFLHLDSPDPLGPYLEAVARQHGLGDFPASSTPSGWCSWYHFFTNVTADKVRDNLRFAASLREQLPLGMIQLDDGFESQVGDWFSIQPQKFPDGLAALAAEIHEAGFRAGLWLAPFIVHPKSDLAARHPDWLLRDRRGRPVNAGFIWNAFTTALDLTHPEARQYTCDVVQTAVREWGYDFLKLDFLYAAALRGQYRDPTKTRAQVLRQGLASLRQAAGPRTTLLGCGCPLGPALGLVDVMRIGPDVAPRWKPAYFNLEWPFHAETDMPSARNAIHNTLTRAALHRRWWVNDPDCLLLRPEARLTLAEVQTLATVIALSGGALLLSDHLPALPPERLRLAAQLLPLIGQRPQVLDWFDHPTPSRLKVDLEGALGRWHLLAWFNWQEQEQRLAFAPADFDLPAGDYLGREFWSGQVFADRWGPLNVPPHGCVLLAVRRRGPREEAQYVGSDLHLSQGLEVAQWEAMPSGLRFCLERPGPSSGQVFLRLPTPSRSVTVNDEAATIEPVGEGTYRLLVNFYRTAHVQML